MKWQKRLNIALTVALTIAFILFGVFVFGVAYQRVFEALIDLYGGFKYYLCVLFGLPTNDLPSVTDYSKVMEWTVILPSDFEGICNRGKSECLGKGFNHIFAVCRSVDYCSKTHIRYA